MQASDIQSVRVISKSGTLPTSNIIKWSYDIPVISQITVQDHPANAQLLVIRVYGSILGVNCLAHDLEKAIKIA